MNLSNCEIRIYSEEHYLKTVEWLNREDIQDLFGLTYQVSMDSHQKWIAKNCNIEILALYFQNTYVGNIILDHNLSHCSSCLQIYIGSLQHRGMGLGKKFMKLALDYVLIKRGQNRVWLLVRTYNDAARSLYVSLGFRSEGIERESVRVGDKFIDQEKMSLLRNDWMVVNI